MIADWQRRKAETFVWWAQLMLSLDEPDARETLRLLHKHADDALSPDVTDLDDKAREAFRRLKRHRTATERLEEIRDHDRR